MEMTDTVSENQAFDAERTSNRFTSASPLSLTHLSWDFGPSHGRRPRQYPSGAVPLPSRPGAAVSTSASLMLRNSAVAIERDFPQSQRIVTLVRSPVVPRSSTHNWRRQGSSRSWRKPCQSMSSRWPTRLVAWMYSEDILGCPATTIRPRRTMSRPTEIMFVASATSTRSSSWKLSSRRRLVSATLLVLSRLVSSTGWPMRRSLNGPLASPSRRRAP
jgi:hypothetical protein